MKVYLELEALEDGLLLLNNKWKKGEVVNFEMDVFSKKTGMAFNPLDKRWKILKMKLIEYKPINNK